MRPSPPPPRRRRRHQLMYKESLCDGECRLPTTKNNIFHSREVPNTVSNMNPQGSEYMSRMIKINRASMSMRVSVVRGSVCSICRINGGKTVDRMLGLGLVVSPKSPWCSSNSRIQSEDEDVGVSENTCINVSDTGVFHSNRRRV